MSENPRPTRRNPAVLATDLDGTLIPLPDHHRNVADLNRLREQLTVRNIELTYVTGRHLAIVEEVMIEHQLPEPHWIICDVGTSIYQKTSSGWEGVIPYSERLAEICASLPMAALREHVARHPGLRLQEEAKQGAFKLSFYVDRCRLEDRVAAVTDWLREHDAPYSLISSVDPFTGDGLIDLLPLNVSKAFAVDWWRSHCGFDDDQIVFAGDSGNDWAALTAGYRSILVANADPQLRQRITEHHASRGWIDRLYVASTPATSGVLEGCRAFGLLDQPQPPAPLGSTPLADNRTRFAVWAPRRNNVDLEIHTTNGSKPYPLDAADGGYFAGIVEGVPAGTCYSYRLDGCITRPDPMSRFQPEGVHGPSQVIDPNAYPWNDGTWKGIPKADLVVYELHVGTFTTEGTFAAATSRLPELVDLGVTAVEIMPIAEAPGRWNWGYDGVDLFGVSSNYGTPDEFRAFVDAAHAAGIAVILDVVHNHVGPEGNYLADFGPYFSAVHHTPWGDTFNFDGPVSQPVRQFILENAHRWLEEYHLDGLRLDAVHCMFDRGERWILDALRDTVTRFAESAGRHIHLIAETNVFDNRVIHTGPEQKRSYDAQWCDDIMHSIYALIAPNVKHTDRDYEGALDLAESLQHGFIYVGPPDRRVSRPKDSRFMAPEDRSYLTSLVIALQNHDVVGNDPCGRRFHQLASVEGQKAAAALILLYPAIPLLFMGEEDAVNSPFYFFTDFEDEHLRRAVEEGRAREYPHHQRTEMISAVDPRAFHDSKLSKRAEQGSPVRDWYRTLIQVRKQWLASGILDPKNLQVECDPARGIFSLQYHATDQLTHYVITRLASPDSTDSPIEITVDGTVMCDSQGTLSDSPCQTGTIYPNHSLIGVGTPRI